jgi:hypothetical protein
MQIYCSEARQTWVLTGINLPGVQEFHVRPNTSKSDTLKQAFAYLADARPTHIFEKIGHDRYASRDGAEVFQEPPDDDQSIFDNVEPEDLPSFKRDVPEPQAAIHNSDDAGYVNLS